MSLPGSLEKILFAGIDAVRPVTLFPKLFATSTSSIVDSWQKGSPRYLLCIGKAAVSSAESILPHVVCEDYFLIAPASSIPSPYLVHTGSHPIPDVRSNESAINLVAWLKGIPAHSQLLVVLSGGASALMVSPRDGISLESKMQTNDLLIRSGATIHEINTVRKHLSQIKGGQLTSYLRHLNCGVLVISDVIGNDLSTIGSGPFYPDHTTFENACEILKKYALWDIAPEEIRSTLLLGVKGKIRETPKPGKEKEIPHQIIASNQIARRAATEMARSLGYQTDYAPSSVSGYIDEVVARTALLLEAAAPRSAFVQGGEITLRVDGNGTGGRNQHFSLVMTKLISGRKITFAAVGTDGVDGNSPAAGSWTDGDTWDRARSKGLDYDLALKQFDSYSFFHSLHQDISPGPTGTNVMDLYIGIKD